MGRRKKRLIWMMTKKKKKKEGEGEETLPPDRLLRKSTRRAANYAADNKTDEALRELIRCVALVRIVEGNNHWKLARAHVKLATAYFDLKGYTAQVAYHTDFAESIIRTRVELKEHRGDREPLMVTLIEMYHTLGRALTADKKYAEAEAALTKAERISEDYGRLRGVDEDDVDDWTAKICVATGRLAFKQNKPAVALSYFERALKLMKRLDGEDSVALIPVYQSLGRVEQSRGSHADHSRAIEHYLQGNSIACANYADDSREVADAAYALALAYAAVGEPDADSSAESYLREALMLYEGLEGDTGEKVLEVKDELARLLIRAERVDEGIELLRTTVAAKQERYGDLSPQVANAWKLIGSSHLSLGESEKALSALKKCHTAENSFYGKNGRKTKDTQRTLDLLLAIPELAAKEKQTGSKPTDGKGKPRFNSTSKTTSAGS